MIRRSLSLRTQLIFLLGALVVVATGSLGSIASYTSRAITQGSAAREVGVIATARRQALIQELNAQNERAAALLKTVSLGCEPAETWCLRKVLADYVATGGATAVRLAYRGHPPITIGREAGRLAAVSALADNELARFDVDAFRRPLLFHPGAGRDGRRRCSRYFARRHAAGGSDLSRPLRARSIGRNISHGL